MNVLYIWDADYPWDIRVEKICLTLAEAGHHVHIAARNLKRRPEQEVSGGITIHRLRAWPSERMNYALSFPTFFSPVWGRFLNRVVKDNNINIVIVRDLPMAIAGIWTGMRNGIPVIFDMAEDYVAMIRDIWDARKFQGLNFVVRNPYLAKLVERYVLRKSDHILVVVEEARDLAIKRGAKPEKITIVSNTPPLDAFVQHGTVTNDTIEKIRNHYSVIYTGGVQMGRGIQVVFDAIPEIVKEISDFLFVIVGDGYAEPILKERMAEKDIQDHVLWVGWVDHRQIFDYIRVCRIGIIPHFVTDHVNTTIPNKIFDYMGLGLPVIASDAVPMKRVLKDEDCGITFRSGDATDLKRAVIEIARSEGMKANNGINAVKSRYNWGEDAKRLLSVIQGSFQGTE